MALTITERMRMTAGGKAWRTYEVVHDSSTTTSLSAGSMDLNHIEAIIGVTTNMSWVAVASNLLGQLHVSIAADHSHIVWASTAVCTQMITVVGW